jgi:predicted small metal-binding protein
MRGDHPVGQALDSHQSTPMPEDIMNELKKIVKSAAE